MLRWMRKSWRISLRAVPQKQLHITTPIRYNQAGRPTWAADGRRRAPAATPRQPCASGPSGQRKINGVEANVFHDYSVCNAMRKNKVHQLFLFHNNTQLFRQVQSFLHMSMIL